MTPEPTPLVTVLPCDRQCAVDTLSGIVSELTIEHILLGRYDTDDMVQSPARHRLAALEAAAKHLRKIADEPASADDTGQQCARHICLHFAADEVCALAHPTPGDSPCNPA